MTTKNILTVGACALGASIALLACAKDTAQPEPAVQAGSATTPPPSPFRGPHRALHAPGIRPMMTLNSSGETPPPPSAVAPAASSTPPLPPFAAPPTAAFVDVVAGKGSPVVLQGCDEVAIAVATGKLTALGETLLAGDVLLVNGTGSFDMKGAALVAVGRVVPRACEPLAAIDKKIVRGKVAPPLVWGQGAMTAHLDVDEKISSDLYVGRLEGTAPVAEHEHAGVYELLCAVQADGVLTIGDHPQIIGAKTCTVVPPNTKHSWKPANGSKLVAIQMYAPPGPEQRFKKLAADEVSPDGG